MGSSYTPPQNTPEGLSNPPSGASTPRAISASLLSAGHTPDGAAPPSSNVEEDQKSGAPIISKALLPMQNIHPEYGITRCKVRVEGFLHLRHSSSMDYCTLLSFSLCGRSQLASLCMVSDRPVVLVSTIVCLINEDCRRDRSCGGADHHPHSISKVTQARQAEWRWTQGRGRQSAERPSCRHHGPAQGCCCGHRSRCGSRSGHRHFRQ